jgi:multicomponent Na+:H+ antiporter subunit G
MREVLVAVLMVAGAGFVLVAALGVLRLPDLPMRMHAATKAGALGAGLLLLAVAAGAPGAGVAVRALAALAFLALTAPVASHAIGRAAYRAGEMPLWEGTVTDELRDAAPPSPPRVVPVPGIAPHA